MGFFDDLKATAKSEMEGVKRNVKAVQLQSELNDLKREETEVADDMKFCGNCGTKIAE
jgi:hypothetical protein